MLATRPTLAACIGPRSYMARALASSLLLVAGAVQAQIPWTFELPRTAQTSAGIYDRHDHLVRTLWRGQTMTTGRHAGTWDQRDDAGHLLADGDYSMRLLHHQVRHVWEGVIGNSSASFTGPSVFKAFHAPASLASTGQQLVLAMGYNEGQPGLHLVDPTAPQGSTGFPSSTDAFVGLGLVAADATRLYWASTGGLSRTSLVGATDLSTGRRSGFRDGLALCLNQRAGSRQCYEDQDYRGVIDIAEHTRGVPTGLAVQRGGRVLAVAHGGLDEIRLFDKHSGEALGTITLALADQASNQLTMAADGDLWAVSGREVLRITDLTGTPRVVSRLRGFERPLALAAPDDNHTTLWVADGGASQQLHRIGPGGATDTVIGQRGGQLLDPAVTNDRHCFRSPDGEERTALAIAPDRTLWVVDTCNNRLLRYRLDQADGRSAIPGDAVIAYLPHSYRATVDTGNPRRVFSNFLEFEVASGRPLSPGSGSWTLVRNWLANLPPSLVDEHAKNEGFGGFVTVQTLANGRTYGVVPVGRRQAIVELPARGPLRLVRLLAPPLAGSTPKVLYENGALGHALTGPSSQRVLRQPLTGFDERGDPVWAAEPVQIASVPTRPGTPFHRGAFSGMPPRFPQTAAGHVVFFDQAVEGNEGFHLGASIAGGTDWFWQASPTGALDDKGSFQTKAIDRSIHYGGSSVWTHGRHVIYGFHGEFFRDLKNGRTGQASQFMHFDESGLFVGQFGTPTTRATSPAQAGVSGNAFSPTLVHDGRHLYLYHNDESVHGGVHRWRIEGWDELRILQGRGRSGGVIELR